MLILNKMLQRESLLELKTVNIFYKSLPDNTEINAQKANKTKHPANLNLAFIFKYIQQGTIIEQKIIKHKEMKYFQKPCKLDTKINKITWIQIIGNSP